MSIQRPKDRPTVIEESVKPQVKPDGTVYVCIPQSQLRKAGFEPKDGDVPDEVALYYHDGGDRDGILESDLKDHE